MPPSVGLDARHAGGDHRGEHSLRAKRADAGGTAGRWPRVLSDRRLEVAHVSSLRADLDSPQVLAIAAGIAARAARRGARRFPSPTARTRTMGCSRPALPRTGWALATATRAVRGPGCLAEAARQHERGNYVLVVSREVDGVALGLVALRPRLEPGAAAMLAGCEQRGVRVELLAGSDTARAEALAARVGLPVSEGDGVEVVRRHQRDGQIVAFLSDSQHAAAAFAAADLAIALTSGAAGTSPRARTCSLPTSAQSGASSRPPRSNRRPRTTRSRFQQSPTSPAPCGDWPAGRHRARLTRHVRHGARCERAGRRAAERRQAITLRDRESDRS